MTFPPLSLILMKVVLILRSTASSIEHKNDKLSSRLKKRIREVIPIILNIYQI